ncbi:MAG: GHKL domain-containing protein [Arcobacteraceae bacterium]|nr:GHKL domain-containing protein [Arcobacteraceae bacterium]
MIQAINNFFSKTIKRQLIITIVITNVVFMSLFIVELTSKQKDFLHEQSLTQTISLTTTLAKNATSWVLANDYVGLEEIVNSIVQYPELHYAMIFDTNGKVLAHTNKKHLNKYLGDEISLLPLKSKPITTILINNSNMIDIAVPILRQTQHIGWARVALSLKSNTQILNKISLNGFFYTTLAIILGIIIAYILSISLTKNLYKLISIAKQITNGKRDIEVDTKRIDEIGSLSKEINSMLEKIKENEQELRLLNKNLEEKVTEKTIKLEKQNRELEESDHELQVLNANLEQRVKEEVEKNIQIQKQLFKSEKMASMGEMIGNIAHQWRQPLSIISTGATGMKMKKTFNTLDDKFFEETCDLINDNAQYLSKTIDDFRNFIKGDRVKLKFDLEENINSFLKLVDSSIKNHSITMIYDLEKNITLNSYPNELIQCYMNIFNNAKDILDTINENDRFIKLTSKVNKDRIIISFQDSGGGIDDNILEKIFEPYFTTKDKKTGTGLGLHMTYTMVVEGMGGQIEVNNDIFQVENKEYKGANFSIILPLK